MGEQKPFLDWTFSQKPAHKYRVCHLVTGRKGDFDSLFSDLQKSNLRDAKKVWALLDALASVGREQMSPEFVRTIDGMFYLRAHPRPQRIFFDQRKTVYILTYAFTKKRDDITSTNLKNAKLRFEIAKQLPLPD